MKKILILCALFVTIFSTCHADAVKISNIDAEKFLQGMRNVLYSDDVQKNFPIAITNLVRGENDLKEQNLKVWLANFGKQGAANPDGEVTFYVDNTNCVHTIKITVRGNDDSGAEYSNIFAAICNTLGLTQEEGLKLFSGGQSEEQGFYHSELERADKIFFVITALDNNVTRTLFMAADKNG